MEGKKASAAHMKATAKWEKSNYDKVLIRFPRGTKDRIAATGRTINGYIVETVLQRLDDESSAPPLPEADATPEE